MASLMSDIMDDRIPEMCEAPLEKLKPSPSRTMVGNGFADGLRSMRKHVLPITS